MERSLPLALVKLTLLVSLPPQTSGVPFSLTPLNLWGPSPGPLVLTEHGPSRVVTFIPTARTMSASLPTPVCTSGALGRPRHHLRDSPRPPGHHSRPGGITGSLLTLGPHLSAGAKPRLFSLLVSAHVWSLPHAEPRPPPSPRSHHHQARPEGPLSRLTTRPP